MDRNEQENTLIMMQATIIMAIADFALLRVTDLSDEEAKWLSAAKSASVRLLGEED